MSSQVRTQRGPSFRAEQTEDGLVRRFRSANRLMRFASTSTICETCARLTRKGRHFT